MVDSELEQLGRRIGDAVGEMLFSKWRASGAPVVPEYYDPNDAATFLGFTPKALERFRSRGVGPKWYRVGRSIRYKLADLRAWVEAGEQG